MLSTCFLNASSVLLWLVQTYQCFAVDECIQTIRESQLFETLECREGGCAWRFMVLRDLFITLLLIPNSSSNLIRVLKGLISG